MTRQSLPDQADGSCINMLSRTAIGRTRNRMTQPAGLAQGLDQFAAFGIHIGVAMLELVVEAHVVHLP